MKTAIETLLEQIVLKQVNDSVYLIPTITDIQIEEAKALFKQHIIDAVKFGNGRAAVEDKESLGEHYFTTTFNEG